MAIQYRRSRSAGKGTRVNATHRGVGLSQRVGPLSLSTRGFTSLRLAPGLSWRSQNKGTAAAIGVVLFAFAVGWWLLAFAWQLLALLARVAWWSLRAIWVLVMVAAERLAIEVRARGAPGDAT